MNRQTDAYLYAVAGMRMTSTRGGILRFRPAVPAGAWLAIGSAYVWAGP